MAVLNRIDGESSTRFSMTTTRAPGPPAAMTLRSARAVLSSSHSRMFLMT